MGCIIIQDRRFDFEAVKNGTWKHLDPKFKDIFVFCEQWLNGQEKFLLRTSGSTGKPKTIEVSRKQMLASAESTKKFFRIENGSSLLCCLDTEKIAGKMMMVRAMAWDAMVSLVAPSSKPLSGLDNSNFDFVAMVPFQVKACLEEPTCYRRFEGIKILIVGGAPTSSSLRSAMKELKCSIFQTYGMTETLSHIALADLKKKGPLIYKALPGVILSTDAMNRLLIKAPVTSGTWVTTQDMVERVGKDRFIWKGRADFVINSGGIKLHPEEIEEEIRPIVEQFFPEKAFFITGKPDEELGEALILLLEGVGDTLKKNRLLNAAKYQLPKYHVPKSIVFVNKFEMTLTGKVNRIKTIKRCM